MERVLLELTEHIVFLKSCYVNGSITCFYMEMFNFIIPNTQCRFLFEFPEQDFKLSELRVVMDYADIHAHYEISIWSKPFPKKIRRMYRVQFYDTIKRNYQYNIELTHVQMMPLPSDLKALISNFVSYS